MPISATGRRLESASGWPCSEELRSVPASPAAPTVLISPSREHSAAGLKMSPVASGGSGISPGPGSQPACLDPGCPCT